MGEAVDTCNAAVYSVRLLKDQVARGGSHFKFHPGDDRVMPMMIVSCLATCLADDDRVMPSNMSAFLMSFACFVTLAAAGRLKVMKSMAFK